MKTDFCTKFFTIAVLVAIYAMSSVSLVVAQDTVAADENQPAAATDNSAAEQPAVATVQPPAPKPAVSAPQAPAQVQEQPTEPVFRKRLPNYYNRVVDKTQREQIYTIQKDYFTRIADLKRQLAKLEAERDQKIEAVLSTEQLTEVEKIAAEAKKETVE